MSRAKLQMDAGKRTCLPGGLDNASAGLSSRLTETEIETPETE